MFDGGCGGGGEDECDVPVFEMMGLRGLWISKRLIEVMVRGVGWKSSKDSVMAFYMIGSMRIGVT